MAVTRLSDEELVLRWEELERELEALAGTRRADKVAWNRRSTLYARRKRYVADVKARIARNEAVADALAERCGETVH